MTDFTRRAVLGATAVAAALPATAQPRPGGTLKVSTSTRCASLHPLKISALPEYMAADMLYSGLTRLGLDFAPQPDLALAWEANADATAFTFRLRPGVTFAHGRAFTAEDVVATVRAVLDPRTGSPARAAIGPIDTIEAVDTLTVRFGLKSPFADLPVAMAHPNARICPADVLANDAAALETRGFGTGPFRVDTYDSARLLRMVKNPTYFVPGLPYLDAVEQYLFPDLAAESANFLNRTIDVMLDVQQADYRRISTAQGVTGTRVKAGRFANLVMRMDSKPFDDVRVRRALALSMDRPTIAELVLEGYGRVAPDNPISPEYRFFQDFAAPRYDPAAAKRLLTEAGYPQGVKIPLICSNRPAIRTQFGVAIKEMARAGGFDIDVQTIPHDTYLANVWRKGQFYVGYWNMRPTEDSMFTLLFTSDAPFADSAWNSKPFDDLVAAARRTTDTTERKRLYADAQRLMAADLPYVLPFWQDVLTASHAAVRDWTVHPLQLNFYVEKVWLGR